MRLQMNQNFQKLSKLLFEMLMPTSLIIILKLTLGLNFLTPLLKYLLIMCGRSCANLIHTELRWLLKITPRGSRQVHTLPEAILKCVVLSLSSMMGKDQRASVLLYLETLSK